MVVYATFSNISVVSWLVSFIGGGKLENPEKTDNLS
jgi:hypothetical protein